MAECEWTHSQPPPLTVIRPPTVPFIVFPAASFRLLRSRRASRTFESCRNTAAETNRSKRGSRRREHPPAPPPASAPPRNEALPAARWGPSGGETLSEAFTRATSCLQMMGFGITSGGKVRGEHQTGTLKLAASFSRHRCVCERLSLRCLQLISLTLLASWIPIPTAGRHHVHCTAVPEVMEQRAE